MYKIKLNENANLSYKIGVDEVSGLKDAIISVMKPVATALNDKTSWGSDDWFSLSELEYKSRDGFIPHSHNHGGIEIAAIIPDCGQSDFPMLEWPEYTPSREGMTESEQDAERDLESGEGLLDSHLRIILKFEGICPKTGHLKFYLNACTCDEAPYFRLKYSRDLFEAEFQCASVKGLKRGAAPHLKALLTKLEAE